MRTDLPRVPGTKQSIHTIVAGAAGERKMGRRLDILRDRSCATSSTFQLIISPHSFSIYDSLLSIYTTPSTNLNQLHRSTDSSLYIHLTRLNSIYIPQHHIHSFSFGSWDFSEGIGISKVRPHFFPSLRFCNVANSCTYCRPACHSLVSASDGPYT